MKEIADTRRSALLDAWRGYDPIEDRQTIRAMTNAPFEAFIGRCRHRRAEGAQKGDRQGHFPGQFGVGNPTLPRNAMATSSQIMPREITSGGGWSVIG